jgi:hypothetical protein
MRPQLTQDSLNPSMAPRYTIGDTAETPTLENVGVFSLPRVGRCNQNMMTRSGSLADLAVSIETRIMS